MEKQLEYRLSPETTRARGSNGGYVRETTIPIILCWHIVETRKALLHPPPFTAPLHAHARSRPDDE